MEASPRDQNHIPADLFESSTTPGVVITGKIDPLTGRILVDNSGGGGGSGTVTSVSVVSANGFAGTVANPTTTPAITLSTTVTGILKGNGTAISAASAGTDYQAPITLTTTGTSGAATFVANTLNIPQYSGGGGTPGGLNTQLQYNNSGSFGGITGAVTDGTSVSLSGAHLLNPTINGAGVGLATLAYPNTASSVTITFPATTGTVALTSDLTGFVTSVSGTTNRITSSGGTTPAIDIAATYVGQTSITTLGTIATGTWQGTVIAGQYGGTGVANIGKTITLGGNFTTSGAFATTLTSTATTTVTLPTTGILATLAGSEALTNKSVNGVTLVNGGTSTLYLSQDGTYTTPAGGGTVSSVASADGSITVTNPTSTVDLAVVKAPIWSTARLLAGNSVNGSANVAFANKFIVQGTTDTGLSGAQFLGALGTGIVKNTTSTGVLSIAIAADFPTLNQNTTGSAATLTTPRTIGILTGDATSAGSTFDGSANNTNALTLATVNSNVGSFTNASITVNAKGLITAASSGTALTNPMTTLGDIIYEDATPTAARLAGNTTTTKKYLSQTGNGTISAVPSWAQVAVADISGFGTGVATWLATPSSANLASALTDETGTGLVVFSTSPSLTTPKIITSLNDTNGNAMIGFTPTTSAINYLTVSNSTSSNPIIIGTTAGAGGTQPLSFAPNGQESLRVFPYDTSLIPESYVTITGGNETGTGSPDLARISIGSSTTNAGLLISAKAAGVFSVADGTDMSKRASFSISGATTATATTLTFSQTSARTITFPDATDTLVGKATTDTLTNKRITPRVTTTNAPGATPSTNTDNVDVQYYTGVATAITSMTTNLSGTATNFQNLIYGFLDNGTGRAITWGTSFEASTVTLPTTTVASTLLLVGFKWNPGTSKWRCVAVA